MGNKRFFVLITKSQTEKLSNTERKELEKIISLNPDLEKDAEFVTDFWTESEFNMEANGDHVFGEISRQINSSPIIPLFSDQRPKRKRIITTYRAAAAIIIFLVFGIMAVFIVQQFSSGNDGLLVDSQLNQTEKQAQSGQKLRIFLPDGSIVWLNSETKLKYDEKFGDHARMVELEGEAFFEIVKKPEKPFIVKSGTLITTALGTSFNIRGYSSEDNIQVTLVSGKVLVESEQTSSPKFMLDPGYGIHYLKENGTFYKEKRSVEKIIGWKDGILRFDNDNCQTVIEELSRWYGVKFVVENSFKGEEWRYSGWFENEYLDIVLESISFSQGFDYKIENEKVTLKMKKQP